MWRNLLRANLAYGIGSAANSLALFLLIPYLVNTLTPAEYGAWALFEVAILLLQMLILTGLDVGLMRDYWFLANETERARLAGTVLLTIGLWGGIVMGGGVIIVMSTGLGSSLPGAPGNLVWVLAIAWAEAVFGLLLTLFRIREKAGGFVALSVGRMVLFMALAIGLIQLGGGVEGALVGRFTATLLGIGAALAPSSCFISLHSDWAALRRVMRYGLPLLPTNLASYILFASDRYVLEHFATLEMVAIYAFAYKIATTLDVGITRPFALDWAPRRFKIAARANAPRQYAQILVLYLLVVIGFALFVIAVTPAIYTWLAPPLYRAGMGVIPVILLAYILYGLSYPLNVGIMLKDRTQYLPFIGWLAAGLCLGLNLWWIPRYGIWGAAWATVVAYSLWTGGIALISLRLYAISYPLGQIGWAVGAGLIGYGGMWALDQAKTMDGNVEKLLLKLVWIIIVLGISSYQIWRSARRAWSYEPAVPVGTEVTSP
jgi:O-antigen/teichoic acid export membrane protein